MKTKLLLLMVVIVLVLSACVVAAENPPTPMPPVEISPEPTTEPATEEPQPTQEPPVEPTAEVVLPATNLYAYVKNFQIYLLNPSDLSVVRMGDSNHPFGYSSDCWQSAPRLSLDGRYLAFEVTCVNAFVVYDLIENTKIAEIIKASDPEILGDTLLGWAEDGRLYYTRMVGGCSFEPELKGPERMEVYSYEPVSGGTRYEFDLPKVDDAPHAYSIGLTIDPQAAHVIAWNAACSVGLGTRFLLTTSTGDYELEPNSWPASFGDISGHYSAFPAEQYVFGADGGKLFVLKDPELEWDPNSRLMFLAAGASEPQQIDSGSFNELVSQAPLVN
jgi:hypothetical protein